MQQSVFYGCSKNHLITYNISFIILLYFGFIVNSKFIF
nr:MAG TPA: hypothetical protein [Caudoviricetes sp.]